MFALIRHSFWVILFALMVHPVPMQGQASTPPTSFNLPTRDTVWNTNLKVLQPVVVTTSRMLQRLERSTASLGLLTRQDAETFN
ncbi:MAG: hypothetical protein ACKO9W_11720, partial [Bacteroidota bacterium]